MDLLLLISALLLSLPLQGRGSSSVEDDEEERYNLAASSSNSPWGGPVELQEVDAMKKSYETPRDVWVLCELWSEVSRLGMFVLLSCPFRPGVSEKKGSDRGEDRVCHVNIPYDDACPHSAHGYSSAGHRSVQALTGYIHARLNRSVHSSTTRIRFVTHIATHAQHVNSSATYRVTQGLTPKQSAEPVSTSAPHAATATSEHRCQHRQCSVRSVSCQRRRRVRVNMRALHFSPTQDRLL